MTEDSSNLPDESSNLPGESDHLPGESDDRTPEAVKPTFWRKYRNYFFIALAVYALLIAFLLLFSAGPEEQPFIYQIF